jgi:AcrR family transcriptional regulator
MYLYDMKRTKADAELTRETLLRAALEVFTDKGFERSTLDDIAQTAKVTRGAVYHHFKNKAEMYQTLLLETSSKSVNLIPQAISEGGSFLEIIERIFTRQLAQLDSVPEARAKALFALRGDYKAIESVTQAISERQQETWGLLIRSFAEAQAASEVRSDLAPRDVARAFVALQNGLLHISSFPGQAEAVSESAVALAKIFIVGIKNPE